MPSQLSSTAKSIMVRYSSTPMVILLVMRMPTWSLLSKSSTTLLGLHRKHGKCRVFSDLKNLFDIWVSFCYNYRQKTQKTKKRRSKWQEKLIFARKSKIVSNVCWVDERAKPTAKKWKMVWIELKKRGGRGYETAKSRSKLKNTRSSILPGVFAY